MALTRSQFKTPTTSNRSERGPLVSWRNPRWCGSSDDPRLRFMIRNGCLSWKALRGCSNLRYLWKEGTSDPARALDEPAFAAVRCERGLQPLRCCQPAFAWWQDHGVSILR